ncbi:phage portal protein [Eubacterium sp. TM05-53]|nr:phage portal protein [Eubacterium sp. TM05-53]
MGLFKFIFGNKNPYSSFGLNSYFSSLSGYQPVYTSQNEGVYELSLVRACIHSIATECSKATPVLRKQNKSKEFVIAKQPNAFMTASQFYYRLATIYQVENNAFIVPIEQYDKSKGRYEVVGIYPIAPSTSEIVEKNGKIYVKYTFGSGETNVIEYDRVGHLRKMQYKNDFFGQNNDAFNTTADVLEAQEKISKDAMESSANLRFIAKLNSAVAKKEDMMKQQEMLQEVNLGNKNKTGVFMYDARFEEMKPYDKKPVLLDSEQKKAIDNSVFNYWGVNENILQNKYNEDEWNAFYESMIEPFFIQVGEVLTKMLYTDYQRKNGDEVLLTSDRLQYASNQTKIQVAKEFFDRGIITTNQALCILNMPPVPDGDKRLIRAEYVSISDTKVGKGVTDNGGQPIKTEDNGSQSSE